MKKQHIFYLILALFVIDYLIKKRNKKPKIYYSKSYPEKYNANTIPPFGIFINEREKGNQTLLKHELTHWKQYQDTGAIFFYVKYFYQYLKYGYDEMPLEQRARKNTGETKYCINNYTECVRKGKAKTLTDPDFRK